MGKGNKIEEMSDYEFRQALIRGVGPNGAEVGKMLKRYNVEGVDEGDGEWSEDRDVIQVRKELNEAMMNDYDTRRPIEAAALSGNEEAKEFANKGIGPRGSSMYGAWNLMKDLKKEHVGGGGMRGPENEAGLTHALVQHDRDTFNESIDDRIASSIPKEAPPKTKPDPEADKPSAHLAAAQDFADLYKTNIINNYVRNNSGGTYKKTLELSSI